MIGILLANTGSPDAPTAQDVRRYLSQFLADRRIVDLPPWLWQPFLQGVILNTRPFRTARLYRQIWTPAGAPLKVLSQRVALGVQASLQKQLELPFQLELGMRYGSPSIGEAMRRLRQQGCQRLLILPLFPQYSTATTATISDVVLAEAEQWRPRPEIHLVETYSHQPVYLRALEEAIRADWKAYGRPQGLLFSFHGLPESRLRLGDPYPQHCWQTARQVAEALGLLPGEWRVSFQSRFGPATWIKPATGDTLRAWGAEGLESLGVICPGFAVDCLETLEEIAQAGRSVFQQAGGGEYRYIPALNDHPNHILALSAIIVSELSARMAGKEALSDYSTSL